MNSSYEDREAIRALTARYNAAADGGDVAAYTSCFTEDGTFTIEGWHPCRAPRRSER